MNLIDFGFQNSNLFRHMPLFDEISYIGHNEEKVRQYKAIREGQTCNLLALNFIRNDEKILWDAIGDFLKRSIINATSSVRGVYIFDLLTIDIHKEIKTFKHTELTTVIINVAGKLAPGEIKMIKPQKCVKTVFLKTPTTRVIGQLLAKTKILRQTQFLNPAQSLLEFLAIMVIFGKEQNILAAMFGQFGWQNQEIGTNRVQGSGQVIFGQAQPFEPVDYIGREQKQLEERHIGFPGVAGNFAQRIIVQKFPVVFLDGGSGVVKQVNAPRRDCQIGNENMINVAGIFEQSQLLGFLRIFWNRTTNHNETMLVVPLLMNVLEEFPRLPAIVEFVEPAPLRFGFESRIFLGHDDVTTASGVEESNYSLSVESRIHPEANAASGDFRGSLVQAHLQELDRSGRGSGISRAQSSVPEFLAMCFETEERMIRPSSRFLGIVANSSTLLFAVNSNDYRIQIENQAGAFVGQAPEVSSQAVVKSCQLTNRLRIQPFQKPAQSCLIWKTAQAQNLQEESVVLQDLGLVDPFQSHNNGVEQCQDQLGRMINLILPWETNQLLQKLFEPKLLAKTVNQEHSTVVRQMASPEENFDISSSFWHNTQTVHFGRFLCGKFYKPYYTLFPSKNTNLNLQNNRISRIFED